MSRLGYYETEERHPNYEMLQKLAELFNCTTDYLLGRTNNRNEIAVDEPSPQEIEDILQNQVMFEGVPLTDEEKESVREFIRLAIKTIRAKNKEEKGQDEG